MRRVADLSQHGVVGGLQRHLQDADAVSAVADRRDDAPPALTVRPHLLTLALQHTVVHAALQVQPLTGLLGLTTGRGKTYQPLTDEVHEQKGHALRTEPLLQVMCHHVDRLTGRGRFRSGEQLTQFQVSTLHDNLLSAATPSSPTSHNLTCSAIAPGQRHTLRKSSLLSLQH